ncbi:MAG: sigma-70 family RNA polymerase sigma factor [Bacteroidales bacterium]|nr:sigma-70 family RNA polymerase sigma factor [Bacteroidales bacterium]
MTKEQFREIFDSHFDAVRNYIYYRSGDQELATDIAQDTFLKFWEKQFGLDKNKVKPLLFKIAGDLFVSNYRKQQSEINFKLQLTSSTSSENPIDQLNFKELHFKYENTLAQLPEKQRVVFMMSRMDEMKYHEIAQTLGLSIKAVEKRMKLALDAFKKVLNR